MLTSRETIARHGHNLSRYGVRSTATRINNHVKIINGESSPHPTNSNRVLGVRALLRGFEWPWAMANIKYNTRSTRSTAILEV
jgi:hypothetical protein